MTPGDEQQLLNIAQQVTRETIRQHPALNYQADEILSDALLGIAKAVNRYNPTLGVPLGAYARQRARGEVLDGLRERAPVSRHHHANGITADQLLPAQRPPLPLEHTGTGPSRPDPGYQQTEDRMVLTPAIRRLSRQRAQVLIAYYLHDRTLADIGRQLGITESACHLRLKGALADLRKLITLA